MLTWNYSSLLDVSSGIAKCELNMVAAGCSVDRPLGDCFSRERQYRKDRQVPQDRESRTKHSLKRLTSHYRRGGTSTRVASLAYSA